MAITRINTNTKNINPVYNNLTYYFTSTNKANDGFRYIAQIKDKSNNLLFEKTITPVIETGECILQIDKELSDYITYNFDITKFNMPNYNAVNSYLDFKIEMGEEYNYSYNWYEYVFASPDSVYWSNGGNEAYNPGLGNRTAIVSSSNVAPLFQIGDWIYINQPVSNNVTSQLNGSNKIIDIVNVAATISGIGYVGWMIVLDRNWIGSSTTNGGTIRYDDNNKAKVLNELTLDNQMVFNTYLNNKDYLDYTVDDYLCINTQTDVNFLTNLPTENYVCRKDDILMLNYLSKGVSTSQQAAKLVFENDNGDVSKVTLNRNNNFSISQIDVSPRRTVWGSLISGTLPIIKPNTKFYTFYLVDTADNEITKRYTVKIDNSCNSVDALKLIYMDKFGSFLSFNFDARNTENINVKREMYKKYIGGRKINGYSYSMMDAATKQYHQLSQTSYELNTGYLNDTMSESFRNVLESPITYLELGGELVRCNITTNTMQVKKKGWYEQKQYKINVTLSNDENINN